MNFSAQFSKCEQSRPDPRSYSFVFQDLTLTMEDAVPLFVMSPHPNDLDGPYFFHDLVDETVLDIDAT